ncbi:EF-hand calcium-binding domain-containing protein 1 [Elysia marginata]|uniref:EF-hand calcium-binding domain-containing protein 1 n=1 Tax=Elysia marginata TaxID=1093978 RepID=A0AAV4J6F9_9GAST|nr:EF-hand calcium-binding domain-containing protein 1 [Elysia marginata]
MSFKKRFRTGQGNWTSFDEYRRQQSAWADELIKYTGVDKHLIMKFMQYAQALPAPEKPDVIGEQLFKAQMGYRFGITSRFHLQCMYEAARRRCVSGVMRVQDYVKLLCMFHSTNLDIKIDFVFSVYDINNDGVLEYRELYQLLGTAVMQLDDDSQCGDSVKELIEIALQMVDNNRDGRISLEEYRDYVKDNILFIQLFGQVLPGDYELQEFVTILEKMSDTHLKDYFQDERRRCLNTPLLKNKTDLNMRSLYSINLDLSDIL